jgi:hypothetical protein
MGDAPNTSANLSCLGLKWHANFWEPRSGQLQVGRPTAQNLAFRFRTAPSSDCDAVSDLWMLKDSSRISVVGVRVSPAGVRPITSVPPAAGAIIELVCKRTLRRDPCRRAY